MAPDCSRLRPLRCIIGMVITPVVTTFDTTLPEIEPNSDEARIAILAAPPRKRPIRLSAMSVKKAPPPVRNSRLPNSTKQITTVATMRSGAPIRPELSQAR
ncbi:MAG: hypothetical protein KatS3mg118_2544 [Paracoccaceae bacterium]|nr:MAG: hypothetical protein KatS3mg118_2544 [Paracoccaceae bacterium]